MEMTSGCAVVSRSAEMHQPESAKADFVLLLPRIYSPGKPRSGEEVGESGCDSPSLARRAA
jgi:hypothetical protein